MISEMPIVTVTGTVSRILYSSDESGWCAIRLTNDERGSFAATGPLLGVREGDELRLTGKWIDHKRFGEQFETASYVQVAPSTLEGIRKFLGTGRIKGIGPTMAGRIVETFGLETLDILDHDPRRLIEIHGIGKATLDKVIASWEKHRGIQQIMVFLTGHGIAPGVAVKAYGKYGAAAVDVVRDNPYRLADEVFGVGFRTADRIAQRIGTAPDSPNRLRAGLLFSRNRSFWKTPPLFSRSTAPFSAPPSPRSSNVNWQSSFTVPRMSPRCLFHGSKPPKLRLRRISSKGSAAPARRPSMSRGRSPGTNRGPPSSSENNSATRWPLLSREGFSSSPAVPAQERQPSSRA